MRLVSYNILDGGLGRADPIGEILEAQRADIVTLVEADDLAVVQRIATRLKMDFVHCRGKSHGCAILSRFAICESINRAPLLDTVPDTFAVATIAEPTGQLWHVGAVHLKAHANLAAERERLRELEAVLGQLRTWRDAGTPHLLAGDFNANSPVQRIVKEKCKPRTRKEWDQNGGMLPRDAVRSLLDAGYVDTLHARLGDAAGEMGSFSTQYPGQRVDYVFAHAIGPLRIVDAWIEVDRLAKYASDHYPVGVDVRADA